MSALSHFAHWFTQYPMAAATIVYEAAVCGVLVYAYFEPRDQM